MECPGSQDSKELLASPQSGQAKGERSAQRLSRSLRLENPAELRPKNTLGGQQNESMFLLSSRPTPRTSTAVELSPAEDRAQNSPQKTSPSIKVNRDNFFFFLI
ncbi:serine/threonine-protein kinase ULK4-like [Pteropus vampyrus]|uniref:Serine/threonine-protein kinase ULK4-like n=1 Tax=Pteropus vampyrus TaxID=132908 RepID=A0A6P3RT85_PTEVA|nr:serine/threonine-protein kinase ULK4-like [Pteropus vampyrus]